MRTNIDIDDKLMKQAMKATGAATKKATVEAALRQTVDLHGQRRLRDLFGRVAWRGPDDDWFASDAEILAKRQAEETKPAKRNGRNGKRAQHTQR